MPIYIAHKTLVLFEKTVAQDQGAAFRRKQALVFPHLGDAYRGVDVNPHRSHLGASGIGKECDRAIWYSFHWFTKPQFDGRMLRLFNRGHLEEGRFISLLLASGIQVFQQDEKGNQYRISEMGGHFGGSGDGVGIGIPDLPLGVPCLLEFKTHNDKSFTKLAGKNFKAFLDGLYDPSKPQIAFDGEGVQEAKFEHYVQMNVYAHKMGLPFAIYGAVNKNDDAIYLEIIPVDPILANQFIERGKRIIRIHSEPPKKISNSPGWFECKFCDHRPVCHLNAVPQRNCRTCYYSLPKEDGKWYCTNVASNHPQVNLDQAAQMAACSSYLQLC